VKIEAVIFDLDNTLMNRKEAFEVFAKKIVDDFLVVSTEAEREGILRTLYIADRDGYRNKDDFYYEIRELFTWRETPLVEEFIDYWFHEFPKCAVLMDGALEILTYFKKQNVKLGLITNGSEITQNRKIDQVGLRKYFDSITVTGELGIHKPDRRVFIHSLEQLGVKPERAVYIGDHPINDVKGPEDVGIQGIWYKGFRDWETSLGKPKFSIDHLSELESLIEI
jgi:HAD superfamily hydrolase (TIGR01549 family)